MKALLIGRFQPFHKGHLKIIQKTSKEFSQIIIGIGSSQYGHILEDPFTAEERKLMIEKSLENISVKNYRIVLIPDIHNPPKWVDHVMSIISDFGVVISNNSLTKRLFSEKGYEVKETPLYNKDEYSGKEIRRRMIQTEQWENLIPKEAINILIEIDGVKRLKELSKK